MNRRNLIIIGSGPAGLTAGIYAARADLKPLILEGKNPGGQLMGTTAVENWPGEKSIMGPKLMMNMKEHAQAFNCDFLSESATQVDFNRYPFVVTTTHNKTFHANSVIISTGAVPKRLGCPGEDEYWGRGVTTCAVCDGAFYKDKKVVIIGGGDTAMEDASFMTKFTKNITVVQILDTLTASPPMQHRILDNPDIKVIYSSTVKEIHGDGTTVTGVTLLNEKDGLTTKIPADGVFVAIGLHPNTKIFEGQIELDKYGYIKPKKHTMTSVDGVFACGDVTDYRYRQAITSAGSGCMAALDAERYLATRESISD